jgi:hypothetical protein
VKELAFLVYGNEEEETGIKCEEESAMPQNYGGLLRPKLNAEEENDDAGIVGFLREQGKMIVNYRR